MYKVYVREEHGIFARVEENIKREEIQSKIDEWLERGYEEVIVLDEGNYVMGKKKEKGKVLRR